MAVTLVEKHGVLVAESAEATDTLTADAVNSTLDRLRPERG